MNPQTLRRSCRRTLAFGVAATALLIAGCASDGDSQSDASQPGTSSGSTAVTSEPGSAPTSAVTSTPGDKEPAVSCNECPSVVDASSADFYPIQPSFSAGYTAAGQKLNSDTADWAYVVEGDFPYSNWMAWYLYDTNGVPIYKVSDQDIIPNEGSTNPFVDGNPVLAPKRSYTLYFMPSTTPASVVSDMQAAGKNVGLLPAQGDTPGVSIVSRSYWSFANDGLGDYDRFGYAGPTDTPYPILTAFLTDPSTGELTSTPVDDCGSQSQLPEALWYNRETNRPVVTFEKANAPSKDDITELPKWLMQTGSFSGAMGEEFPPSPVPNEVQFYRNVAANAPYADVSSAPPKGNPPDACGGYVMANLPNDVVSVVHIAQVPTFPNYTGATEETLNSGDDYDVSFYSIVIYGAEKQLDAFGTLENSQLGNTQIAQNDDGSATVVLYPRSATQEQIAQIAAVVEANGWNLLKSGKQTDLAPNLLVIREKGQNQNWENALSANEVTQGAPCPQSTNSSLPLPQDPPDAQVTQTNGMGLSAPAGENCSIDAFLSGGCVADRQSRLQASGQVWSATGDWPTQLSP
ncbi:MAG: hypothetical protein E4H05_02075 [Acidimicrobiales bacterium]|nr:MAG: hypothetical protein E4H05_02075 [Acidimicrobiales bacterium]